MIHTRLKGCWLDQHCELVPLRCSVDPITLTGLAIGALGAFGGAAASGAFSSHDAPAAPMAPPATPAPAQQPQQKPASRPTQPSFIGAAATPAPSGSGQKTLLGQ